LVETGVLIGRTDYQFTIAARNKIRMRPADHVVKGSRRNGQREDLPFAWMDRNGW